MVFPSFAGKFLGSTGAVSLYDGEGKKSNAANLRIRATAFKKYKSVQYEALMVKGAGTPPGFGSFGITSSLKEALIKSGAQIAQTDLRQHRTKIVRELRKS